MSSASFGRIFDNLLGNESFKDFLLSRIQSNDLRHCNILTGPEGIGKKALATGVAQELLCNEKKEGKACGFCPNCIRTAKLAHENLLLVEPEPGSQIKMENARAIQKFLQLQSDDRPRIIVIDQVEKMNQNTANALLKTFEEPPTGTYFFLITNNYHRLLETIRSRSQIFRLQSLNPEILKKKTTAEDWQIRASGGSFGALKFWREESRLEFRNEFIRVIDELSNMSFSEIKSSCESFAKDKSDFPHFLELMNMALRDCISYQINKDAIRFFPDQQEFIAKMAGIPREKLFELQETCFNIEQNLNINIDRPLHLESFFLKLARLNRN